MKRRLQRLLWALMAVLAAVTVSTAASAHKEHRQQAAAERSRPGAAGDIANRMAGAGHDEMPGMSEVMDRQMEPANLGLGERLLAWIGRIHPLLVHFPIAFFPAALFTAIVGRRRPSFAAPVQFLVVAGGIFAPIAAGAGWLAGLSAEPDAILAYHRWLGVAIGAAGAGLGWWAWKRPWEDRGAGMILALTAMTIAIAVQGFLGASVTHGMEHMMF